jgi:hypothetical protein
MMDFDCHNRTNVLAFWGEEVMMSEKNKMPEEEVMAVLVEGIQGIEEEIAGLRKLARGLLAKQKTAVTSREAAQLANAHTRAAWRLAEIIEADKQLDRGDKAQSWADDFLRALDRVALKMGEKPVGEKARAEMLAGAADLSLVTRRLAEEIASVRYMLRKVLELALQSEGVGNYVRMVEIYGSGCLRLVRMLKKEGRGASQLEEDL